MEKEQWCEFDAVRDAVFDGLRTGRFAPDTGLRIVSFVILPSFEDSISWELRSTRSDRKKLQLSRSQWFFGHDCDCFRSPVERAKHPRPFKPRVVTETSVI